MLNDSLRRAIFGTRPIPTTTGGMAERLRPPPAARVVVSPQEVFAQAKARGDVPANAILVSYDPKTRELSYRLPSETTLTTIGGFQAEPPPNSTRLATGEYVSLDDFNKLSRDDQLRLSSMGVEGFNQYQRQLETDFRATHRHSRDDRWYSNDYLNELTIGAQNVLLIQGLDDFNTWIKSASLSDVYANTDWKPDFSKANPYEGKPSWYDQVSAAGFVPTAANPVPPSQAAQGLTVSKYPTNVGQTMFEQLKAEGKIPADSQYGGYDPMTGVVTTFTESPSVTEPVVTVPDSMDADLARHIQESQQTYQDIIARDFVRLSTGDYVHRFDYEQLPPDDQERLMRDGWQKYSNDNIKKTLDDVQASLNQKTSGWQPIRENLLTGAKVLVPGVWTIDWDAYTVPQKIINIGLDLWTVVSLGTFIAQTGAARAALKQTIQTVARNELTARGASKAEIQALSKELGAALDKVSIGVERADAGFIQLGGNEMRKVSEKMAAAGAYDGGRALEMRGTFFTENANDIARRAIEESRNIATRDPAIQQMLVNDLKHHTEYTLKAGQSLDKVSEIKSLAESVPLAERPPELPFRTPEVRTTLKPIVPSSAGGALSVEQELGRMTGAQLGKEQAALGARTTVVVVPHLRPLVTLSVAPSVALMSKNITWSDAGFQGGAPGTKSLNKSV